MSAETEVRFDDVGLSVGAWCQAQRSFAIIGKFAEPRGKPWKAHPAPARHTNCWRARD